MRWGAGQAAAVALAFTLASCRCNEDLPVRNARVGFQPDVWVIDFGRHLEGERATATLDLTSTGRGEVTVEASTSPPFETDPLVVIPPSGRATLSLAFTAGSEFVERDLVLHSAGEDDAVAVTLRGTGVRPLQCVATELCTVSTFDVPSGECVDSVAPEGTPCVHPNPCLFNGRCDPIGQCIAEPRPCDDNNVCTNDFCSLLVGCVHTTRTCPAPGQACMVATCHPTNDCGVAPAPLGTLCGPVDCVTANVCDNGACVTAPTPEGFPCSPPTPCQGAGTCHAQTCVQPDAGVFPPTFSLPLAGVPTATPEEPGLLQYRGNLYAELCGPAYDAGCALVSWTSTAFERFAAPHGAARAVLTASDAGVWMLGEQSLSLYRLDTGAPVAEVPLASLPPVPATRAWTAADRYAADPSGELWLAVSSVDEPDAGDADAGDADAGDADSGEPDAGDAGAPSWTETFARVVPDGGVERFPPVLSGTEHRLAFTASGALYAYDGDGGLSRLGRDDAGAVALVRLVMEAGAPAVIAGGGRVLAGNLHLLDPVSEVVLGAVDWSTDAGEPEMLHRRTLLASSGGYGFFRSRSPDGGTYVLSFDPADGGRRWVAEMVAPGQDGLLVDAVPAADGGLGALVQVTDPDGGLRTELQVYFGGDRVVSCPLLPDTRIAASVFGPGAFSALVLRDGGWTLEIYDLTGAPLDFSGWPSPNGLSGTRREQ
ncbi:MAG TPA: hypothetical protein VND93_20885 [Myxococcales bacterium]|nr:hypothetical protein [Myxococcales bacterium]